jgi:hypothetical protein
VERSPAPQQIRPGQLILRTDSACSLDPQHLLAVFTRQRQRFAAVLAGFTPGGPGCPHPASQHARGPVAHGQLFNAPVTPRSP